MEFVSDVQGERLDKFLAKKIPRYSRMKWQRAVQGGAVRVNGHSVTKPGFLLRAGDRLVVLEERLISPDAPFAPTPEPDIPISVVYEDDDIVVVNKPAGLLVHPTLRHPKHTLVNALVARYPSIVHVGESPLRPGIVHRLDKNTSGLLIVAKHDAAFRAMKEQFLNRTVTKKYLALVEGTPPLREGVIEYPLRPSKKNRLKKVAVKTPDEAVIQKRSTRTARTKYRIVQTFGNSLALLEVQPLTGRTHQIRAHLAAIGCPVAGDRLYGGHTKLIARQFLHASYLECKTPGGAPLALETELPEDLRAALLRASS